MFSKNIFILYFFIAPFGLFGQSDESMSYQFNLGADYHILQYRANIREEPARSSRAIAILSLNDKIEILENSGIEENINGVWGFWYKIKYGNIIGYTFGGNIALKSFTTDLSNNGINDYFYFRFSNDNVIINNTFQMYRNLNPRIDLFIYINNQRINTYMLKEHDFFYDFNRCEFDKIDNYVLIRLMSLGRDSYISETVYKIDGNGNLEYLEKLSGYIVDEDYENDKIIPSYRLNSE